MRGLFCILLCIAPAFAQWPQFRGPNYEGVAESGTPPTEFGPQKNLVWRLPLPAGKSSPIFSGDNIFLTAHEGDQLLTLCIDRNKGTLNWSKAVTRAREEKRNKLNDAAAPTPVTDGEGVYSFFADFGLVGYSKDGKELWRVPLPSMLSMQGVAASPVLYKDRVILVVDGTLDSYMLAVNTKNGETIWRKPRRPTPGGAYASPVLFHPKGQTPQFVTFSPFEIAGYSLETGEKLWWVSGLPPQPKATPLVVGDVIYSYARSFYGDALPVIPVFSTALEQNDKNHDGVLSKEEVPEGPAKRYFGIVDHDKSGTIDAKEWESMIEEASPKSMLFAIRPQGSGDLTGKAMLWQFLRNVPDVPMPLLYRDVLYIVQNGGILSALDPKTGTVHKQGRLTGALGDYYTSPVAANGNIYFANQEGKISVVKAAPDWQLLTVNDMGEECFATPAIVGGDLYMRTAAALYRFTQR